jgi:hypothetical protein
MEGRGFTARHSWHTLIFDWLFTHRLGTQKQESNVTGHRRATLPSAQGNEDCET